MNPDPLLILDPTGVPVTVGTFTWDDDGVPPGEVIEIREPFTDNHDDGTPLNVGPRVVVRFHDCEDTYGCRYIGEANTWVCDDLDVLTDTPRVTVDPAFTKGTP